jgi:uncharacterized protein YbbK (DUF523 family)
MEQIKKETILISACLVGVNCRWDGKSKMAPQLEELKAKYRLIPVCPEVLGGLGVPRPKAWIQSGDGSDVLGGKTRVIDENGHDVTGQFIAGAHKCLQLAIDNDVKEVILKAKSPSCGYGTIKRGDELVEGNGVTAELLKRNGVKVKSL